MGPLGTSMTSTSEHPLFDARTPSTAPPQLPQQAVSLHCNTAKNQPIVRPENLIDTRIDEIDKNDYKIFESMQGNYHLKEYARFGFKQKDIPKGEGTYLRHQKIQ